MVIAFSIEVSCPVVPAISLIADFISGRTPGLCSAHRDIHDLLLSPIYVKGQSGHSNLLTMPFAFPNMSPRLGIGLYAGTPALHIILVLFVRIRLLCRECM
jgi:hypothetical protein